MKSGLAQPAVLLMLFTFHYGEDVSRSLWRVEPSAWDAFAACAARSPIAVEVTVDTGRAVQVAVLDALPPSSWVSRRLSLPFDPGPEFAVEGHWSTQQVEDGWFVALDRGEFGGGLWWFPPSERPVQLLERRAVQAVGLAANGVYAISEGHFDPNQQHDMSVLMLLVRKGHSSWRIARRWDFAGTLRALYDAGVDGLYILSSGGLVRWTGNRMDVVLEDLVPLDTLKPFTIATDSSYVYVGMRLFLLRASKETTGMIEWFVPRACQSFTYVPYQVRRAGYEIQLQSCVCTAK